MTTVLRVSRWREIFETADSRKHKVLTWISVPIRFNSTGYQHLLETFETELQAAAIYGAWCALLKVAATASVRGVLAGSNGEPYTVRRLSRITGFPELVFDMLIPWAKSREVGWLEEIEWQSIVDRSAIELPDLTGPDQTKPDQIPVRSGGGQPVRSEVDLDFLPDWPELHEYRNTDVAVTREECSAINGEIFDKAEGTVFSRAFAFEAYVEMPERSRLWHAIQTLMPNPVVGNTVAHQVLVMAACRHAAKVPQAQIRKTRQSLLIGILKATRNPTRWDAVRSRIPEVQKHATATPLAVRKTEKGTRT